MYYYELHSAFDSLQSEEVFNTEEECYNAALDATILFEGDCSSFFTVINEETGKEKDYDFFGTAL